MGLESYGTYVGLEPNVVGLVLGPEIRWSPVRQPGAVLRVGEAVRAEVLVVNGPKRQIGLSIERLLPRPTPDR